jgi:hypothetical protein
MWKAQDSSAFLVRWLASAVQTGAVFPTKIHAASIRADGVLIPSQTFPCQNRGWPMSDNFFVVTGGPGAGKTSQITELAHRGFHTIPESDRAIIRAELQSGGDGGSAARPMQASCLMRWNRPFIGDSQAQA